MKLQGKSGSLDLRIAGYQFPDSPNEEDDADWLMIEGWVTHPSGNWTFCDPCLMTDEVEALAAWLEAMAKPATAGAELSFYEPNLRFSVPTEGVLRVDFDLEIRPPWAPANVPNRKDVFLEFEVDSEMLLQAAEALRLQANDLLRSGNG